MGIIPAKKGPQKLDFSLFRFSQSAVIDTCEVTFLTIDKNNEETWHDQQDIFHVHTKLNQQDTGWFFFTGLP